MFAKARVFGRLLMIAVAVGAAAQIGVHLASRFAPQVIEVHVANSVERTAATPSQVAGRLTY